MDDIVERMKNYIPGEPAHEETTPEILRLAIAEIERLRNMCINREEFIANNNLWREFSKYLSEMGD